MPINKNEITKEMIAKAMQCHTSEELRAYAKSEGYDITREEAEAYLEEFSDIELDETSLLLKADLKNVDGKMQRKLIANFLDSSINNDIPNEDAYKF